MSASLSQIPAAKRRQVSATLGLFAVLLVAVGAVAATGPGGPLLITFVAVSFAVALVLALLSWGVAMSLRSDTDERRLDATLEDAVAEAVAAGSPALRDLTCGCGHDHDPDELHVTDNPCDHDGAGLDCTHSCDTCVLARLRPEPVAARPRPTPGGRAH